MKYLLTLITLIICFTINVQAQPDTLKYCVNESGIGVGGYDPVSYFNNKLLPGKKEFTYQYEKVNYLFSSIENQKKFKAAPKKYLPQFGGWCSMTLAMGRATTPTYDNFAVLGGKLYLFERTLSVNGRELWLKDPKAHEKTATTNYTSYRVTGKIK
jgi:YHS domain-containing protein